MFQLAMNKFFNCVSCRFFFSCTDSWERVCSAFVTMRLGSQEEKSMTQHLTKGDIDDSSCMNMAICDIPPYTVI